jgi:hypothetical protein
MTAATTAGLLTADEIARVRRPFRGASLLPGRAYHGERFFDFERREWFGRDWIMVERGEDVATPGSYMLAEVDQEPLVIVRGRDSTLRGRRPQPWCARRARGRARPPAGRA